MATHSTFDETSLSTVPDGNTETAAAVAAGRLAGNPQPLDDRFFTVLVPGNAKLETIDLEELGDRLAAFPRRKTGTRHVQDAASFVGYLSKHGTTDSEVWADPSNYGLVGVVNADRKGGHDTAGHGDHRVILELLHTDEWKRWVGASGKWMDQQTFAEHIEDNAVDIVDPDSATMLEIAQHFHASTSAQFERGERLDNGLVNLKYKETLNASAGQTGDLDIPTAFVVSIAPFHTADRAPVTARFRYRIRQGTLSLSYALLRPEDVARKVYDDIVGVVDGSVEASMFYGRPA